MGVRLYVIQLEDFAMRPADLLVELVGDADERIVFGLVQVTATQVEPGAGGDFFAVGATADAVRTFDHGDTPAAIAQGFGS